MYGTFLLWLLSELFERLPEVGDPEKPTLVFFFDEAHLLFEDAEPSLVEKIEQTVRLIRSTSAFGASLNSRCASSKKNTSFGLSRSPTSGSCSNSSDSSHSRKVA